MRVHRLFKNHRRNRALRESIVWGGGGKGVFGVVVTTVHDSGDSHARPRNYAVAVALAERTGRYIDVTDAAGMTVADVERLVAALQSAVVRAVGGSVT